MEFKDLTTQQKIEELVAVSLFAVFLIMLMLLPALV